MSLAQIQAEKTPSHWTNFTNEKKDITLEWIKKIVAWILEVSWKDIIVGTTWSTWRSEEYANLDEIELLLYSWENISNDDLQSLQETIKNFSPDSCRIIFESKNKSTPDEFEWITGKEKIEPIFFPSRFIDYLQIHGSEEDYNELTERFISNIQSAPSNKIKWWKKRIRNHRLVSEKWIIRWKGDSIKLYDTDNKIINYSRQEWGLEVSIKIWALRYIQYQIVQILMILIRLSKIEDSETFQKIWSTIEDKIDFLSEYWLDVNFLELQELKWLYVFFLWIHNRISKKFNKDWEWSITFTNDEFKLFESNLNDFNTLMKKFKLKA